MSYYTSNYYQNPGPYYVGGDQDEPVPGWGLMPNIAGPERIAVGQTKGSQWFEEAEKSQRPALRIPLDVSAGEKSGEEKRLEEEEKAREGFPIWGWMLVGSAVGLGVSVLSNRGMLPW